MAQQIVRHVEERLPQDDGLSVDDGGKSPVAQQSTSGDTSHLSLGRKSWREQNRYTSIAASSTVYRVAEQKPVLVVYMIDVLLTPGLDRLEVVHHDRLHCSNKEVETTDNAVHVDHGRNQAMACTSPGCRLFLL